MVKTLCHHSDECMSCPFIRAHRTDTRETPGSSWPWGAYSVPANRPWIDRLAARGGCMCGGGGVSEPLHFPLTFAVNLKTKIEYQLRVSKIS